MDREQEAVLVGQERRKTVDGRLRMQDHGARDRPHGLAERGLVLEGMTERFAPQDVDDAWRDPPARNTPPVAENTSAMSPANLPRRRAN